MKTLRFGIYAGALWALVSLTLISASMLAGYRMAWVELDFRTLTCAFLLAADALGFASQVSSLAFFAETGLPINPLHIIPCLVLSFADGFASGAIIAAVYNILAGRKTEETSRKVLCFGVAAGIALAIASGLLSLTRTAYGVGITSFEFTVRPVWIFFNLMSKAGFPDALATLRDSYMLFPNNFAGALAWAAWGFIDGLIEGAVLAYLFLKVRGILRMSWLGND